MNLRKNDFNTADEYAQYLANYMGVVARGMFCWGFSFGWVSSFLAVLILDAL